MELLDALADMGLGTFDPNAVATLTLLREKAAEYGMVDVEAKALIGLAYPLGWNASERGLDVIAQALRLSEAAPNPLMRARIRAQMHGAADLDQGLECGGRRRVPPFAGRDSPPRHAAGRRVARDRL